jgi:hypothetical protein
MEASETAPNQGATGDAPTGLGSQGFGESSADQSASGERDGFSRHPELFVGVAFAGGFVAAQILKRLGS